MELPSTPTPRRAPAVPRSLEIGDIITPSNDTPALCRSVPIRHNTAEVLPKCLDLSEPESPPATNLLTHTALALMCSINACHPRAEATQIFTVLFPIFVDVPSNSGPENKGRAYPPLSPSLHKHWPCPPIMGCRMPGPPQTTIPCWNPSCPIVASPLWWAASRSQTTHTRPSMPMQQCSAVHSIQLGHTNECSTCALFSLPLACFANSAVSPSNSTGWAPTSTIHLPLHLAFPGTPQPSGLLLRECHARSAKFWMSANTRTLVLAPFHKPP